jgi:type IV pilus assembly protein PilM
MKSSIFSAVGEFFALDIGSSAVRIVQLHGSGNNRALVKYASVPLDVKVALSDAPADQAKLGEVITQLVNESGVSTTNVSVGLPSNKTFVTIVDMPKMSHQELESTIKYQAEQYIPMAAEEAKIDWAILGDSPVEQGKVEVLLASVTNKFSEQRMDMLEAIGLNVVALEPDSLALARALTPLSGSTQAQMIVDVGEYTTDIIITLNGSPRLVRSIPTGGQSLIKAAMQNLNIDENQARQFVYKFGLDQTKLEGQIFRALESTVEVISGEAQKSIKFFATRYTNSQISGILTSGAAAILPGFHQYLSKATGGAQVQAGNSWQNVSYSNSAHEQLMSINHQFAVAVGLAEREG